MHEADLLPFSLRVLQGPYGDGWRQIKLCASRERLRLVLARVSARSPHCLWPGGVPYPRRRRPSSSARAKRLFITGAARPDPGGAFKSKRQLVWARPPRPAKWRPTGRPRVLARRRCPGRGVQRCAAGCTPAPEREPVALVSGVVRGERVNTGVKGHPGYSCSIG